MSDHKTTNVPVTEHTLETVACYFEAVASGEKTFEVRRDDRGFQRGDILVLRKIHSNGAFAMTGPYYMDFIEVRKRIGYVLTGGQFGVESGYVVMGLQDVE